MSTHMTLKDKVKMFRYEGVAVKAVYIENNNCYAVVGDNNSSKAREEYFCGENGLGWFIKKYLCLDFEFNIYNYQSHFYILSTDKNYCEKVGFDELSQYIFNLISKAVNY